MTFAQLECNGEVWGEELQERRGRQLAGGLGRLGLKEADVVAVMLRNVPQYADVIHACAIGGFVYCAINWHFKPEEVNFLLTDSQARVLIVAADLFETVKSDVPTNIFVLPLGPGVDDSTLQDYESWLAQQQPYEGFSATPRASMPYTSGTSGRPKGIVRRAIPAEQRPAHQARMKSLVAKAYGLREGCRALIAAPVYHSAPGVFLQNALKYASLVVLSARFDAEQFLADIEKYRIDTAYVVPLMYVRLLRLPKETKDKYDISSLRFVASTGAPCSPEVKLEMIKWFGPVIYESYGSSETGMITVIDSAQTLERPASVGLPVDEASIRILDPEGAICPSGVIGLIYVRQPAFPDFSYRGNDRARLEMERDGHLCLGDMGYLDQQGYLYICDRASEMVISGGVNIYPAEIEGVLIHYPGVADCAVFGVPDDEYGERLHALVEPADGTILTPPDIVEWLKQKLASFKVPSTIEIKTLPRDDSGKIAKRTLRDAYWAGKARRI
jgi:long-chain acyl-CoA synthetase